MNETKGMQVKKNRNGFTTVMLHYSSHPLKDNETFKKQARQGFGSEQAYKREYELDFTSLEGIKVLPDFNMEQVKPLCLLENRPLFCGTDWGFIWPAHVVTQFNEYDQWLWQRIFVGNEMLTHTFLEVCKYLRGELCFDVLSEDSKRYIDTVRLSPWIKYPSKHQYVDFCDIAGTAKSDKGKESNIEIARQPPYNMRMRFKKTDLEMGINLMGLRMRKRKDNKYGTLIDESCKLIIQALSGGFVRDKHGNIPDNIYTNPMDALRYILVNTSNERREQNAFTGKREDWSMFVRTHPKPMKEEERINYEKCRVYSPNNA